MLVITLPHYASNQVLPDPEGRTTTFHSQMSLKMLLNGASFCSRSEVLSVSLCLLCEYTEVQLPYQSDTSPTGLHYSVIIREETANILELQVKGGYLQNKRVEQGVATIPMVTIQTDIPVVLEGLPYPFASMVHYVLDIHPCSLSEFLPDTLPLFSVPYYSA